MNYQELKLRFTTAILKGLSSQIPPWEIEVEDLEKVISLGKVFTDLYIERNIPHSDDTNYPYTTTTNM